MTRRLVLAAPALVLLPARALAQMATPRQTTGPFYPTRKPADSDLDLTRVEGRPGRARGEMIEVLGRVIHARTGPLPGATVEIWQADWQGRYHHPRETAGAADPDFQGFGAVRTGSDGGYFFRSVRPRFYGQGFGMRTPHIHFRVIAAGRSDLVTQMYFPGEPLNERDGLYRALGSEGARAAVTARLEAGPVPRYRFEIVLA